MSESTKYDVNGEYSAGYTESFKRKSSSSVEKAEPIDGEHDESNPAVVKANEYMRELLAEKLTTESKNLTNATRLLEQEVSKVQQLGRIPTRDPKYVDIYREKPVKVTVKVLVPVREHPKFNFVGKLLGPKGNSMKRLQEETMCKMAVLGRGSMKDRAKEDELRNSLDPKYAHLSEDLNVEISALGPPAEAHARIAFALAEVRKYLIPDNNDNIRQEQMREMEIIGGDPVEMERDIPRRSILRAASMARPVPPVPMRTATRTPVVSSRSVMPAKTKIMSILDRARVAMEESYGCDDDPYDSVPPPPAPPSYERYAPVSSSSTKAHASSSHYYDYDYEPEYYRASASTSYAPSSSRWKRKSPSSSARHSESRYRTSPYTRPSK